MTQTALIETAGLKAVLYAAAKQDIRYYLNGILIEVKDNQLFMVATDGHRAHIYRQSDQVDMKDMQIIIDRADVELFLKSKPGKFEVFEIDGEHFTLGKVRSIPIDGKFPNWRRIVPKTAEAKAKSIISVDPQYVMDAKKALVALDKSRFNTGAIFTTENPGAFLVCNDLCDNFVAVIMGYRYGSTSPSQLAKDLSQ